MGDVGTETTLRFPGESNGRRARLEAEKQCPAGSHRVEDVYRVDGGYEAVIVRVQPPNSQWDYDRALAAHRAKPGTFPLPDPKQYALGSRNREVGGEPLLADDAHE